MVDSWQFSGSTGHTWSSSGPNNVSFAYNAEFDENKCGAGYAYRTIDVPSSGGELIFDAAGSIAWASTPIYVLINNVSKKHFLPSGSSDTPIDEVVKIDVSSYKGTTIEVMVYHNDSSKPACSYPDHTNSITLTNIRIEGIKNGFTIRVSTALATKNVLVAHVVKMPFTGLVGPDPNLWYWPQAFDYVGGKWFMADPATKYRVEVGSIFETIPPFNKTYGTGSFADGIHCVVLAEGEGGVGSLIFKGEDVFQLFKDSPTEIYLSSTSTDILTEAVMGPVCDFFGIPRGSQCDSFWAEFYDPVYVANYISIMRTGKDTLGNSRELSGFDHIALPFAILGSLPGLSLLPFGALVTKGLGAISKAGVKFGDEAVQFMLNFSMDASNFVSSKDTWYFLDAIGQVTEGHATEIVDALTAGDTTLANTLLRRYAGESKGWWNYHTLNDMLADALPLDVVNWLRTQAGLPEIGAGIVTNVAKQATLSADDVAKLANAATDADVMDEVGDAVYNSVKTGNNVDDVNNILKNLDGSPGELADRLYSAVATGASEVDAIAKNIVELDGKNFKAVMDSWTSSQKVGLFNTLYSGSSSEKALYNAMNSIDDHHSVVESSLGTTKASGWVENVLKTSRAAHKTADPGKMSDIPHAAQEYAASYADVATDMGGNIADDIVKATDDLVAQPTSNWRTTAKQTVKNTSNKYWNYFNGLSDAGQERVVHGMVAGTLVFAAVVLYKIYTDAGPQSLNHNLFASSMDRWYWPCFYACEGKDADTLDEAIKLYESEINDCAKNLYDYETVLKSDGTYDEFYKTLKLHQFNLSRMKICLENLQPCGNIHCTSNTNFFYVDLDGQPAGFSFGNYEVLLKTVKVGAHTVKIHKHNWTPECTETVNVVEGVPKTVDCQMTEIGVCSEVTAVSIYIDPLSPIEGETVSFNGSAKSDDPITTWEWNFGDGFTATGQAVTHSYSKAGIYTVVLKVTNDCENYATTTRNVTVSEEAPPVESTSLTIERMIGTDGNDIPRYWEVEIWVDGKFTKCLGPQTLTFGTGEFCDCESPWNFVPCELGTHTIQLKKEGYRTLMKTFTLVKDVPQTWESPVMEVRLELIYLRSNQTGFDGYMDGVYMGNSGDNNRLTVYDLVYGTTHKFRISKGPGYSPEYCEKDILIERRAEFYCEMHPVTTHDVGLVIPAGAKLWVDGKLIDATTVARLTAILNELRK